MFELLVLLCAAVFWCSIIAVFAHYWVLGGDDDHYRPGTSGSYHF